MGGRFRTTLVFTIIYMVVRARRRRLAQHLWLPH